jgi:hypothetical protein
VLILKGFNFSIFASLDFTGVAGDGCEGMRKEIGEGI